MTNLPFAICSYELTHCSLLPLELANITILSERLAQMHPWNTLGYTATGLSAYLQRENAYLYKYAIVTNQLAGVLCVHYPWLRGAYIELVAVFPEQQGLGIGHDIIQWLTCLPQQKNLWVLVSAINPQAQRFYQRCGFVEVGKLPDLVAEGQDEILLRKSLASTGTMPLQNS